MAPKRPERPRFTVFVGNISYDTTEEQLKDFFSQVGPVVSFRLMYDRETGKPKGFGFCEYEDQETAMSALRNLNGEMVNGRAIRVDRAENDKQLQGITSSGPEAASLAGGARPKSQVTPALPDALKGPAPSLAALPLKEIHEIMVQLKASILGNPEEVRALLLANPQMSHAILQGQMLLGMVPMPPARPVAVPSGAPVVPPQAGQSGMAIPPPPRTDQRMPGMPMMNPAGGTMGSMVGPGGVQGMGGVQGVGAVQGAPGMQSIPPAQMVQQQAQPQAQQLPQQPQPRQAPPPPPPQQQQHSQAGLDEQAALLQQVMMLTPQQVEELPPEQRSKVLYLRETVQRQLGNAVQANTGQYM